MATQRPFDYGTRDYLDRLNDLYNGGMPRLRADPNDPTSAGVPVSADRQLVFNDTDCVADVLATCNLTFNASCLADGWLVFVHVVAGTATLNVAMAGAAFVDGPTSKTILAGNAAIISCNGTGFRIWRLGSAT